MATYSCLRPVATALILALFTAGALAADNAKRPGDHDDRQPLSPPSHVHLGNETAPAPSGGARPSGSVPAVSAPVTQPRFSGSSSASRDNWRDRWDRDHDRDREDRDRRDFRDDQRAIYTGPNSAGIFNASGTFAGASSGVLRVDANGTIWQVKPDGNSTIELTGVAGPDFLRPGLVVKFQAAFDPNGNDKDKAIDPVTALEIITPHPGETIGAVPAAARQDAFQPATARSLEVIGRVTSYKQKLLTVSAGNHVFKADLDDAPQIKVRISDYRFARVGDQVELTGYIVRPGYAVANQISITLAAPLGDPLSEFRKNNPPAQQVGIAAATK